MPQEAAAEADGAAAQKIAAYLACMRAKRKASGNGEQNAEMLLCHRADGVLSIEDHGGWAQRNESMTRMLRELDAAGELPNFEPILIQTGDRCVAKRAPDGTAQLHLWQRQPVPDELRARLLLHRVTSMCSSPKYSDVPIPDWCFDMWPEAGVPQGGFDEACAALAAAGAAAPTDGNLLSWAGTAHHHPSRMQLVKLASEHPSRLAVNNVVDRVKSDAGASSGVGAPPPQQRAQYRTLLEQTARCGYLLDVQGKGYSSRLKLLLHTGRLIFLAARPWQEYFHAGLVPFTHYIPVKEDLSDLLDQLAWADENPAKARAIAAACQQFARAHLTAAAARRALRAALVTTADGASSGALVKSAAWRAASASQQEAERREAIPTFIESSFTCKVDYEAWRRGR